MILKKISDNLYTFWIEHSGTERVYLQTVYYDESSEFGEKTLVLNITNIDTFLNEPNMDLSVWENKAKGISLKISGDNCNHILFLNEIVDRELRSEIIMVIDPRFTE